MMRSVPLRIRALKRALPMFSGMGLATPMGAMRSCTTNQASDASYERRHIGPSDAEVEEMLKVVKHDTLEEFARSVVPKDILRPSMSTAAPPGPGMAEGEGLARLRSIMSQNKILKSCIGLGFFEPVVPAAIVRYVLENPAWYTPYTPYQPEISQGRLEALLNFQTMVVELTGGELSNASLLDEATAASEFMILAHHHKPKGQKFFVSERAHPTTLEMIRTRAEPLGIQVVVADPFTTTFDETFFGAAFQTPDTYGTVHDYTEVVAKCASLGITTGCATELISCAMLKPPGEMGFDVIFGNSQRMGVPLGYGGPHAAFFAVKDQYKRLMPGRIIGVSIDARKKRCLRMALQTREQHIKREKATSNICTAQALLANMAGFYAVFHGKSGLQSIANAIHLKAKVLATGLKSVGHTIVSESQFFDTVHVQFEDMSSADYMEACVERGINVRRVDNTSVTIALDEATTDAHLVNLLDAAGLKNADIRALEGVAQTESQIPEGLLRTSDFLSQPVFNSHRSEMGFMRYAHSLASKDYGLQTGMIPLGSCTMKLNPAAAMLPLTWPTVSNLHPYVPDDQALGYKTMIKELEEMLSAVTGFPAVSCQPNSGSQGEYAGLRVIRAYHQSRGESHRDVCIIPASAHGTNPASAVLAGLKVVTVKCTPDGSIDLENFKQLCELHSKNLAAAMITYPSTFGVFETTVTQLTGLVHEHGGQAYVDCANLNAMVGLSGPSFVGGDVCHMNLHKTFSIPHGGGGPGVGPIGVREHLAPFLPGSVCGPRVGGDQAFGICSQSGNGSASILTVSYLTMLMLGSRGLTNCSRVAMLNANYLMRRIEEHFKIVFLGETGMCGHEFIVDCREFKKSAGIEAEDIAKRLIDYGIHAPTLAFPIAGTLMVEPTESETILELNRFADALGSIRQEIRDIEEGRQPKLNNVLKNAPHTADAVAATEWDRPYPREQAVFPGHVTAAGKFWPSCSRVDGTYGDRNLVCRVCI